MFKKKFLLISLTTLMLAALAALTGCGGITTSKSFTYNVSTGDTIEVSLDTSSGELDLNAEGSNFVVSKNGSVITQGFFLEPNSYTAYEEAARIKGNFKHNIVRDNRGFYYEDDESGQKEYIYMIKLNNSNTAVAMSTISSEADATEVAAAVVFTVGANEQ